MNVVVKKIWFTAKSVRKKKFKKFNKFNLTYKSIREYIQLDF